MESLGFSSYKIMSSVNRGNLTPTFPIWTPFTSFSCLITLVRISTIMLNRKQAKAGMLVLITGGKFSVFHH